MTTNPFRPQGFQPPKPQPKKQRSKSENENPNALLHQIAKTIAIELAERDARIALIEQTLKVSQDQVAEALKAAATSFTGQHDDEADEAPSLKELDRMAEIQKKELGR